ncbi:lasso peptide biosynthesis B2 protein [Halomonas sp. ML-15]|uniref:lasso peptide biosynthesis B2 protein n=1 Tax=Halomonas sp. ML-15 TaxID=2773305 RepID=UPI002964EEF0|nr:lasso peptide biosynthesis B2 protein [Halomonas sp. ML-15]
MATYFQTLQTGFLKKIRRKAISFLRQPGFAKRWFPLLWVLLGLSRVAILLFSFRRLAPYLGQPMGIAAYIPLLTPKQEAKAAQIGQAIRLAARYTPWVSNCFPQAVTARLVLGLYGIPYSLYFGVMREPETREYKAHAWVATGRVAITGGYGFNLFTVVGCYSSLPPQGQTRR